MPRRNRHNKRYTQPRSHEKHRRLSPREWRERISEQGREGNRRGKEREQKFVAAYEEARRAKRLPKWFYAMRKATKQEDYEQKTDAVAVTDVGPIHIQIKSSERACAAFLETCWGQFNICVVVRDNETPRQLVDRTLPKIAVRRHARIQRRRHSR